ncbi:MAG TPA: hypothetical protein VGJ72_03910 [Polaromonas sp.]
MQNTNTALADMERQGIEKPAGPVLFKSCGWASWDLAAARAALTKFLDGVTAARQAATKHPLCAGS